MNDEIRFGKYYFTKKELLDLLYSTLILGFIFSSAFFEVSGNMIFSFIKNFILSLAIVGPALIIHELSHKFVAQKYNLRAEYVFWPTGALFSIMLTLLTGGRVIFAALGAVMISTGYPTRLGYRFVELTREESGKISAAGPLSNIVLAILFYILSPLSNFFYFAANINLIVALFNLLPFPPLDGSKIFGWSWINWGGLLFSSVVLLFLPALIGLFWSILLSILFLIITFLIKEWLFPPTERVVEFWH